MCYVFVRVCSVCVSLIAVKEDWLGFLSEKKNGSDCLVRRRKRLCGVVMLATFTLTNVFLFTVQTCISQSECCSIMEVQIKQVSVSQNHLWMQKLPTFTNHFFCVWQKMPPSSFLGFSQSFRLILKLYIILHIVYFLIIHIRNLNIQFGYIFRCFSKW